MPDVTTQLQPEQVAFFEREGYLSLDAITTQDEVAAIREIYDRLFAERAGRDSGDQFDLAGTDEEGKEAALPQILSPAKYAPELNDTQLLRNVAAIGKQLLGDAASAHIGHAIYKPPRVGAPTPWHQDAAYWNPAMISYGISVWVPLQEATIENGCMHFVPRSQNLDVIRHRSINDDPRIHGLEVHPEAMHHTENAVACPLGPGGATLHGGYMLHYAPPNRSDIPRRALILNINKPGRKRETPMRFPWMEEKQTARTQRAAKGKS